MSTVLSPAFGSHVRLFVYSNFCPVPRNKDIWHAFYADMQPAREAKLVSLAARWLYDAHGSDEPDVEDPPSPLSVSGASFGEDNSESIAAEDGRINTQKLSLPKTVVSTGFDLQHEAHGRMPISRDAKHNSGYLWTEAQRALAKLAKEPETLDELKEEV